MADLDATDETVTRFSLWASWMAVLLCCLSIAWVLWLGSLWFEEGLDALAHYMVVVPQLLCFGLRRFLDRGLPKRSKKMRLHTKQNVILVCVFLLGSVAAATKTPHALRIAVESRLLDGTAKEIKRKCASDSAPIPRFANGTLRNWKCTEDGVSFEAGSWSKWFDRGGTWGFRQSSERPTTSSGWGGFEEVIQLRNNWWVWKQVTWRD